MTDSSETKADLQPSKVEAKSNKKSKRYQRLLSKQKHKKGDAHERSKMLKQQNKHTHFDLEQSMLNELIELLSRPNIVLRPHILFEFCALEIKNFCGTNICISIARDANTGQLESDANKVVIARIEAFVPIINHAKYHVLQNHLNKIFESKAEQEQKNDDMIESLDDDDNKEIERDALKKKQSIIKSLRNIGRSEFGFGIISNRKSKVRSKFSMKWNILDYILYPAFLNEYYKWRINDNLYFSTLFKNFSLKTINDDWQGSRRRIDDTYFNTGNIVNGFLMFLNKECTKSVFLFECEDGLYCTDERILYRNMKVPLDADRHSNKLHLSNQLWIKMGGKDMTHLWVQGTESDLYFLSIPYREYGRGEHALILHKVYLNRNSIANYNAFGDQLNTISDNLSTAFLKKNPYKQSDYLPGHYGENIDVVTDLRNISTPLEIGQQDVERFNHILEQGRLFNIKPIITFDISIDERRTRCFDLKDSSKANFSLFQILPRHLKMTATYFDDAAGCNVLYLLHLAYATYESAKWKVLLRAAGKSFNVDNGRAYDGLYQKFMRQHHDIAQEDCDIMFVDDRQPDAKRVILILGENMMVIPCYNNNVDYDKVYSNQPFAHVYKLSKVVPGLFVNKTKKQKAASNSNSNSTPGSTSLVRGGKWHYSYETRTLYVFERLQMSSKYPYRLRKILLYTFKI